MDKEGISGKYIMPYLDRSNLTSIPIRRETRDRLKSLGKMNETYSDFIERLLDLYEKDSKKK
jgi:hypothetical protein